MSCNYKLAVTRQAQRTAETKGLPVKSWFKTSLEEGQAVNAP